MATHIDFTAEESKRINKRLRRFFMQEFGIKIDTVYVPLSEKEKEKEKLKKTIDYD